MPDWAEKVITWDEAREYIQGGTVESLGKLRRSEQQLTVYRSFMDKVKAEYASVADFVKISVLERTSRVNSEGKKEAVDSEQTGANQLVWHRNDFPYYFEDDVQHWLLWNNCPLDTEAIQQQIQLKFPEQQFEHLMFVNPAALQSILSIWHCHVLVRPGRSSNTSATN